MAGAPKAKGEAAAAGAAGEAPKAKGAAAAAAGAAEGALLPKLKTLPVEAALVTAGPEKVLAAAAGLVPNVKA